MIQHEHVDLESAEPVAAPISLSAIPDPEKYVDVALIAEALRTLATGRLPDLSVFPSTLAAAIEAGHSAYATRDSQDLARTVASRCRQARPWLRSHASPARCAKPTRALRRYRRRSKN